MSKENVAPLRVGTLLNGYKIKSVLGAGGFGITYLATEVSSGSLVVIKENIPGVGATRNPGDLAFKVPESAEGMNRGGNAWSEENFINEARRLAELDHPGVMRVLKVFRSSDTRTAYYVMPYVESEGLDRICERRQHFNRRWVLYLTACILEALAHMHSRNLIHRDIKPGNILISSTGRPILIDFGAARKMDRDVHTRLVTPAFTPIEQERGEAQGPWTDMYALGATLYRVITGEMVPLLVMRGDGRDSYQPLVSNAALVREYGREFLASVDYALVYEPESRCRSAAEWIVQLRHDPDFQSAVPVMLEPGPYGGTTTGGGGNGMPPPRRPDNRWIWALLSVCLVLLALILALLGYSCLSRKPETVVVSAESAAQPAKGPSGEYFELVPPPPPPPSVPEVNRVILRKGAHLYSVQHPGEGEYTEVPAFQVFHVKGKLTTANKSYYHVASVPGAVGVGKEYAVAEDEVYPWSTQTALRFNPLYNNANPVFERRPAVMFSSATRASDYVLSTPQERGELVRTLRSIERDGAKAGVSVPDGVLAIEPMRERGTLQYWMPVLDSNRELISYNLGAGKKKGNDTTVVQVASMAVPFEKQVTRRTERRTLTRKPQAVDMVFVVDTTKSMSLYLEKVLELVRLTAERMGDTAERNGIVLRFGLVGYRDWKASNVDGTGEDEAFTRKIGYVSHYYNGGRLLTPGNFVSWLKSAAAGELPSVSEVDSIDYAEDVQAGVYKALKHTRWWPVDAPATVKHPEAKASLRFVCLVGDAPGRAPGERESSALNWREMKDRDPEWRHRPAGSIESDASFSSLNLGLSAQGIGLSSVFVLTMPKKTTGISEDTWWSQYQSKAIRQYCEMSTSRGQIEEDETPSCYILNSVAQQMSPRYAERLMKYLEKEMRLTPEQVLTGAAVDIADRFIDKFLRGIETLIIEDVEDVNLVRNDEVLDASHMAAQKGESAISRMFACSYMNWLAQTPPKETSEGDAAGSAADFTGWMPDRDEKAGPLVEPHLALERYQLEVLAERIERILQEIESGPSEEFMDSVDDPKEDVIGAMVAFSVSMFQPVDVAIDVNLSSADEVSRNAALKQHIEKLPFTSATMQAYAADGLGAADVDACVERLKELSSVLRSMVQGGQGDATKAGGSLWVPCADGNAKLDCFYLPLRLLP